MLFILVLKASIPVVPLSRRLFRQVIAAAAMMTACITNRHHA
jgi:hypothetical protein